MDEAYAHMQQFPLIVKLWRCFLFFWVFSVTLLQKIMHNFLKGSPNGGLLWKAMMPFTCAGESKYNKLTSGCNCHEMLLHFSKKHTHTHIHTQSPHGYRKIDADTWHPNKICFKVILYYVQSIITCWILF